MKKLLFIATFPPPHYGASVVSEQNFKILNNSGRFIVHKIKLNYSKEMSDVGKVNWRKVIGIFKVRNEIKNELRNFNPDIIYLAPATAGLGLIRDSYFSRIIKREGFKILFHIHSRANPSNKRMIKMLKGQKAIALGNELIKDISPPLERKDIALLPNSLKNDVSDKEFEKIILNRRKRKSFSILFLSNMDKTKGWPKLLQACNILKKRRIKFKCSFVGAWQSKKDEIEFDNFISKNNLNNNVFYLGRKTGAEKNKVLTESDILVFPTEYKLETFGLVILEAMMYGLPVIANGIATIPSTIKDDRTGFILKENFPEEIASRIEILAKNRKLRENMGIKGRKRFLQEFELQKYSKRLISICNSS